MTTESLIYKKTYSERKQDPCGTSISRSRISDKTLRLKELLGDIRVKPGSRVKSGTHCSYI